MIIAPVAAALLGVFLPAVTASSTPFTFQIVPNQSPSLATLSVPSVTVIPGKCLSSARCGAPPAFNNTSAEISTEVPVLVLLGCGSKSEALADFDEKGAPHRCNCGPCRGQGEDPCCGEGHFQTDTYGTISGKYRRVTLSLNSYIPNPAGSLIVGGPQQFSVCALLGSSSHVTVTGANVILGVGGLVECIPRGSHLVSAITDQIGHVYDTFAVGSVSGQNSTFQYYGTFGLPFVCSGAQALNYPFKTDKCTGSISAEVRGIENDVQILISPTTGAYDLRQDSYSNSVPLYVYPRLAQYPTFISQAASNFAGNSFCLSLGTGTAPCFSIPTSCVYASITLGALSVTFPAVSSVALISDASNPLLLGFYGIPASSKFPLPTNICVDQNLKYDEVELGFQFVGSGSTAFGTVGSLTGYNIMIFHYSNQKFCVGSALPPNITITA